MKKKKIMGERTRVLFIKVLSLTSLDYGNVFEFNDKLI